MTIFVQIRPPTPSRVQIPSPVERIDTAVSLVQNLQQDCVAPGSDRKITAAQSLISVSLSPLTKTAAGRSPESTAPLSLPSVQVQSAPNLAQPAKRVFQTLLVVMMSSASPIKTIIESTKTSRLCLDLTTQGRVNDDGSSSYSGAKSGGSGSGTGSGDSSSGGSGSTGKPNGGGILKAPNFILGGVLVTMGLAAQLQI
ncbi:uncharacterized protein DFL_009766 [Arthrobotrys flagrans]|uniref:Uncharacterized protein n=1 Tax=Arthrobotrys flagrans TaxID=97331 RepID=A0A436ZSM2_ARTFL|nr:hypothetical protein DFL_009766 [Arthrobotrys flagrans]